MNGRLYDPRLHRFLQPDNNLQEPYNTQNYNRYGYELNNPLKYTDPTGEFTWADAVASVAIVASVVIGITVGWTGVGAGIAGSLITVGVNHFIGTSIGYAKTGNWDASSRAVGFTFDYTTKTDFDFGGGKKDVANNNNPIEVHNYVSLDNTMITGNEPPVSFFMRSNSDKELNIFTNVFDEKNKKGNYNNDDSIFDIYGHGGLDGNGDGFFADTKFFTEIVCKKFHLYLKGYFNNIDEYIKIIKPYFDSLADKVGYEK